LASDIKGRTYFAFEKWGIRRIIEPKRVDIKADWGNCVMKTFEVFIH
jgi:hypothetical protein